MLGETLNIADLCRGAECSRRMRSNKSFCREDLRPLVCLRSAGIRPGILPLLLTCGVVFRSAGVSPALLTFSIADETSSSSGFDQSTHLTFRSYIFYKHIWAQQWIVNLRRATPSFLFWLSWKNSRGTATNSA